MVIFSFIHPRYLISDTTEACSTLEQSKCPYKTAAGREVSSRVYCLAPGNVLRYTARPSCPPSSSSSNFLYRYILNSAKTAKKEMHIKGMRIKDKLAFLRQHGKASVGIEAVISIAADVVAGAVPVLSEEQMNVDISYWPVLSCQKYSLLDMLWRSNHLLLSNGCFSDKH